MDRTDDYKEHPNCYDNINQALACKIEHEKGTSLIGVYFLYLQIPSIVVNASSNPLSNTRNFILPISLQSIIIILYKFQESSRESKFTDITTYLTICKIYHSRRL